MDNLSPSNQAMGSPFTDDPFFFSSLLSFDSFSDQFLSNELGAHHVFGNMSQLSSSPVSGRYDSLPFGAAGNTDDMDENPVECNSLVPKPPVTIASLAEKMLRALSLFKESSYSGILAQVWLPVKQGDNYVLTTSDQPFLLDQVLAGYREISRGFIFPAKEGLPGRVFTSGMPEWTTNVIYYREQEFKRRKYAITHEVHGSMGVPVFDPSEGSCVAVLELVTKREKPDFDVEMDSVCNALQAVNLSTSKPQLLKHESLTKSHKLAFAEILDVLRAICHAHMLPLALTWVPIREPVGHIGVQPKTMLQIHEPACYANDPQMREFLHACAEHMLEPGQGIAGKALESNVPFFTSDVREYSIRDYPLAHHARKSGLLAAVAVRLRSGLTGSNDYVLEFFLPVNCKGCEEQQLLLNNLSGTMQRMCRSLRTVSEAELSMVYEAGHSGADEMLLGHSDGTVDGSGEEFTKSSYEEVGEINNVKGQSCLARNMERKRSTAEKNISLSVLQKYFSGSLKDAARSLGVCPTTLKRICRQHGIARWPSRKINKVNRSLKKIQHVINSVQGVEGGAFKYDPAMGCLVTGSESAKPAALSVPKLEQPDHAPTVEHPKELPGQLQTENLNMECNGGAQEHSHPSSSSMTDSSSGSASSHPTFKKKPNYGKPTNGDISGAIPFVTVKATFKEDTVRFKFVPSMGYEKLTEEIEKRIKCLSGSFQIKYKDDEDEWVNLSNDLDLQECVDVMDSIGSRNVKLIVREASSCAVGNSSASSSCLVMEL